MSALELIQFMMGSGILTGGVSAAVWVLRTERRLMRIEAKLGIEA